MAQRKRPLMRLVKAQALQIAIVVLAACLGSFATQAMPVAKLRGGVPHGTAVIEQVADLGGYPPPRHRYYGYAEPAPYGDISRLAEGAFITAIIDPRRNEYYRQNFFYGGNAYYGRQFYGMPGYYGGYHHYPY